MKKRIIALTLTLALIIGALSTFVIMTGATSPTPELNIAYCNLSFRDSVCIKYAVKSNISRLTLMEDLEELHRLFIPRFSEQEITQHQSHAMEFFDDMPHLARVWKVKTIEKLSGLRIERSKRNGRTQAEHLALLHEAQSANSCQERVVEWFNNNPGKTQKQCSQELVISQKTVSKWWPTHKKRKKKKTSKNLCPICGAEMTKTKLKPHFWGQKSQYYTRIDKDCPKCGHHIKGKSYPCQRPD